MKKILIAALATTVFAACSKDDNNSNTPETGSDKTLNGFITATDGTDPDYNPNALKGHIRGNITLIAGNYTLSERLIVEGGSTLNIEAGTTVTALAGGTNVLIQVNQGGKINAVGTAAKPIKFISTNKKAGDWGGIVLCGYAPLVYADGNLTGYTLLTEIGDQPYGGSNAHDNSGTLKYVEIAYAGARINSTKEFNNLTLYAVGDGTTLENLYIHDGSDDNIEFFGGTVNAKNLLIVNSADDTFDWCLGWKGTVDNVVEIREKNFTDITNGSGMMEGDGYFSDLGSTPANANNLSNPTLTRFSIGVFNANGVDSADGSSAYNLRSGFTFRTGCKVSLTNSKIVWGSDAVAPKNGLFKFNDNTGRALAGSVNIDINYTGADFRGQAGVTTTGDSPNPGANYNAVTSGSTTWAAWTLSDFLKLTFNNTNATGADKTAFTWTNYDFATNAPGL